ncbi:hypothetical protein MTO96_006310 [Rhipicephalus appendiculatus]
MVDWLEDKTPIQRGMSSENNSFEDIIGRGCSWDCTQHHPQSRASAGCAALPYASEPGPDAPSRLGLPQDVPRSRRAWICLDQDVQQDDLDQYVEWRLFRSVCFHMRARQLQQAQEANGGQHWCPQTRAPTSGAPSSCASGLDSGVLWRLHLPMRDLDRDEWRLFRSVVFHLRERQLQLVSEDADNGQRLIIATVDV